MTGTEIEYGLTDAARKLGYLVFHARATSAIGNEPGFPDLIIAGYGEVFGIECKSRGELLRPPVPPIDRRSRRKRTLPGQAEWLEVLRARMTTIICQDRHTDPPIHPETGAIWENYDATLARLNRARDAGIDGALAGIDR